MTVLTGRPLRFGGDFGFVAGDPVCGVFAEGMSQRTTASLAIRHAAAGTRLPLGSALCPRRRCVCSSSVHRSTIHRSLASSIHRGT